jgi:hypothetical protein
MTHFGVTYTKPLFSSTADAWTLDAPSPRAALFPTLQGCYLDKTLGPALQHRNAKMGCRDGTCCVIESGYDWNTIVIVR